MDLVKLLIDYEPNEFSFEIIENLILNKIPENSYLEYKGNGFLNNKKPKEGFLKDKRNLAQKICSFANIQGGIILFGIEEEKNGDLILPGEITGAEIDKFDVIIQSVILSGTNPPCPYNFDIVEKNKVKVYILKIYHFLSPIMLTMKNHPHQFTFPIRINEQTKYAERDYVKFLFENNKEVTKIQDAMQEIWNGLKKIYKTDKPGLKHSIMRRLFIKYKELMPKLNLIPYHGKEGTNAEYQIEFRDNFVIKSDGTAVDHSENQLYKENHILFMEILEAIKIHWKKQFFFTIIDS